MLEQATTKVKLSRPINTTALAIREAWIELMAEPFPGDKPYSKALDEMLQVHGEARVRAALPGGGY